MNKYSINVSWSEEDGCYVALIPEFPTLSAFGETAEEAVKEAEVALQGFIDIYKEEGYELPEPKLLPSHSGQLRIRIPKDLHGALALEAAKQGTSLNTYINVLLAERNTSIRIEKQLEKFASNIGTLLSVNPQDSQPESLPAPSYIYENISGTGILLT